MVLRAVVFDLDGTLAVTTSDRETLLETAAAAADAPSLDRASYLTAHSEVVAGETRAPIFDRLLDGEVQAEAVADAYRDAINDALEPVAGVEQLLTALSADYRVGLLTDGPALAQRSKLDRLGWADRFDATVVTGEMDSRKPDPGTFRAVCDRLGVAPEEAVYVGDKPEIDVAGASAAGMAAIQVVFDGGPPVHDSADAVVDRATLSADLRAALTALS